MLNDALGRKSKSTVFQQLTEDNSNSEFISVKKILLRNLTITLLILVSLVVTNFLIVLPLRIT